jgi:hypothetical protein
MKIVLTIVVMCILILLLKFSNREHYASVSELQTNYEKSKQNYDIFLMDYNLIPQTESLKREKEKFKLDYLEAEKKFAELKFLKEIETNDDKKKILEEEEKQYNPIYNEIKRKYNRNRINIPDIYRSKYQTLDDSIVDLDSYYSDLYNYSNKVDNLTKNYGQFHQSAYRKLESEIPQEEDSYEVLNPFENISYNKALIAASKMQYVDDVNLYKMNQLI